MTPREARRKVGTRTIRRSQTKTQALNYDGPGGKAVKGRSRYPKRPRPAVLVRALLKKEFAKEQSK